MNILVTNDDGIEASGLRMLTAAVAELGHELFVVAPDSCSSAESMRITVGRPLRTTQEDVPGAAMAFRVGGTAVDCVKLALSGLTDIPQPDLVLSGINYGINVARDLLYSGTVGAAREAADVGLPAIAVSAERCPEGSVIYEQAIEMLCTHFDDVLARVHAGEAKTFANLNVPVTPMKGVRWTRVSNGSYFLDGYDAHEDGYFLNGPRSLAEVDIDTDLGAVEAGFGSITILRQVWVS
ncbi:MAG: 5'-nucleotidase [Rhodothermales bacterium]|jgi:5'-nucleotidase